MFPRQDLSPKTLEEAVIALEGIINDETKSFLKSNPPESAATQLHSSLGRYLRNKWELWHDSNLAKHMKENHGINHPDDMSHAIIVSYCYNLSK